MKKVFALLTVLSMLFAAAVAEAPVPEFAAYEDLGKVNSVEVNENGALIEADGYWGYHTDLEPSMTVRVAIGTDGTIQGVTVVDSKDQTEGFPALITDDYLKTAYVGKTADTQMTVDAATGATATSLAVQYAVQTAAHYAKNALGYGGDTGSAEIAELNEVYPADYKALDTSAFETDAKKLGTVLFAAEGTTADGGSVLAVKVKSMTKPDQAGSARTGWTSSVPNPFTMIVVIDRATDQVCAWKMVETGYKASAYFTVPDELIDTYMEVPITDAAAFDAFADGLMTALEFETEASDEGPMITGTSIVYTGKTEQGTFASQFIRSCFRTAAALYAQ